MVPKLFIGRLCLSSRCYLIYFSDGLGLNFIVFVYCRDRKLVVIGHEISMCWSEANAILTVKGMRSSLVYIRFLAVLE